MKKELVFFSPGETASSNQETKQEKKVGLL
jgi:hypothetical protein